MLTVEKIDEWQEWFNSQIGVARRRGRLDAICAAARAWATLPHRALEMATALEALGGIPTQDADEGLRDSKPEREELEAVKDMKTWPEEIRAMHGLKPLAQDSKPEREDNGADADAIEDARLHPWAPDHPAPTVSPSAEPELEEWMLVPREPTATMLCAGDDALAEAPEPEKRLSSMQPVMMVWQAMLDASPSPSASACVSPSSELEDIIRELRIRASDDKCAAPSLLHGAADALSQCRAELERLGTDAALQESLAHGYTDEIATVRAELEACRARVAWLSKLLGEAQPPNWISHQAWEDWCNERRTALTEAETKK